MTERAARSKPGLFAALTQDGLRLLSFALAALGLAAALYLSYVDLSGNTATMACPAEGQTLLGLPIDCGLVNRSVYAKVGPIPVAVLGVAGYALILLTLALENHVPFLIDNGRLALFGLTLFGFAFSTYLTWAEVAQIGAFCIWCVVSAIVMTLLFILSLIRLRQGPIQTE